jgi:hypothetical protein
MSQNMPFLNAKQRKYAKYLAIALFILSLILADIFGIQLPDMAGEPVESVYPEGWDDQLYSSSLETDTLFTSLATTGDLTVGGVLDVNGGADAIVLDADADTTISADTDDTINVEVSGADDFVITANTLTASSGSSIVLASGAYPLGYATSGSQLVYGTSSITGTATAAHGLTTVTFAVCTLGEDPTSGAGDGAMCTVAISSNVVTVKVWQDDFVSAATETDVAVHWLVVGVP